MVGIDMKIKTSKGIEFECEAITSIQSPPRMYLHLTNTGLEEVYRVFSDKTQLPIVGYPAYNAVQSISAEGATSVKVSLKIEGA